VVTIASSLKIAYVIGIIKQLTIVGGGRSLMQVNQKKILISYGLSLECKVSQSNRHGIEQNLRRILSQYQSQIQRFHKNGRGFVQNIKDFILRAFNLRDWRNVIISHVFAESKVDRFGYYE
jgi:hypothetical protein